MAEFVRLLSRYFAMIRVSGIILSFGRAAPKVHSSPLLRFACLLACLVGLSGCEPDATVVAAKDEFLREMSPQMKVMRDRLLGELVSCETSLKELKVLARSFNQPSAKAAVEKKIGVFELKCGSLKEQLSRIEEEVEKGVALRKFNQIEGGGLIDQDLADMMKDSQSALNNAEQARKKMETELGQPSTDVRPQLVDNLVAKRMEKNVDGVSGKLPSLQDSQPSQGAHFMTTWTGREGGSIKAELVDLNGDDVVLRLPDGRTHVYPLSNLSVYSQALARRLAASSGRSHDAERIPSEGLRYRVTKTTDGYLNMRIGPGLQHPTKGRILGTARGIEQIGYLVYDRRDQIYWMPVRFGGVEGYVSANFLQPE